MPLTGRKRNKALAALPTGYLWLAYSQNPTAQTFPWSGCNEGDWVGDVPRWAVLEELQQREDGRELLYPGTRSWSEAEAVKARQLHCAYLANIETDQQVSIVISTSFTPHPETIDSCYHGVRKHWPTARVYILLDGLREEQRNWTGVYESYRKHLRMQISSGQYSNTVLVESPEFRHEAGQMRSFIQSGVCSTPLICYLQHDAVLTDTFIDWPGIVASLQDNTISCVRFALDVGFPQGKEHMFRDALLTKYGVPLLIITELFVTACIARVDFFQYIVSQFVTARCHLDGDEIQPVTAHDNGRVRRIGCYCPIENEGQGFLRVVHTDARRAGIENPPPRLPTEF